MDAEHPQQNETTPLIDLSTLDELIMPIRPSNDDNPFGPPQPHARRKDELVVQYFLFSFQPAYRKKSINLF